MARAGGQSCNEGVKLLFTTYHASYASVTAVAAAVAGISKAPSASRPVAGVDAEVIAGPLRVGERDLIGAKAKRVVRQRARRLAAAAEVDRTVRAPRSRSTAVKVPASACR